MPQRGPRQWPTQQQQLQLPLCGSPVSPELSLDLGIDAFGLLGLLAEAASQGGVRGHPAVAEEAWQQSQLQEEKADATSCSRQQPGPSQWV